MGDRPAPLTSGKMMRTAAARLSQTRPMSMVPMVARPGCVVRPLQPIAIRSLCTPKKPAAAGGESGGGQVSIIAQATALEHGGKKFGVQDDIMAQPTIAGKAYKATSYLTQFALAGAGICIFGWIGNNLYKNMAAKASPTRMFSAAMSEMEVHPKVEVELGMPIKGLGGVGGRSTHQMEHWQGKRSDGETYTIIKFKVEGAKHDGRVHVEYMSGELNYLAVEVPATQATFYIQDNRRKNGSVAR